MGAREWLADDRWLPEPDQAVFAEGADRPNGIQGDGREPRGQEAGREMGEGFGPELREGPAGSRYRTAPRPWPRHHTELHGAHAGEQGPHDLRQDDRDAETVADRGAKRRGDPDGPAQPARDCFAQASKRTQSFSEYTQSFH